MVYPKAVNFEFRVETKALPDGARPTIVPNVQFFKNVLPDAATAVDCWPYIGEVNNGLEINDCS